MPAPTPITGQSLESGGAGNIGWLSSIRKAIATTLIAILGATNDAAVGDGTGTINAHLRQIAKSLGAGTITPAFDTTDTLSLPSGAGAYSANQAINMDGTISEVAYTGLVVTVKCTAHGLPTGDSRVTIAGVNTGATLTNVDGNWNATYIDANHFSFPVSVQPTGTTPQTGLTIAHAVAKMLSLDVGGVAGGGVILSSLKLSLPGKNMTGTVRLYLDNAQVTTLVNATTYPLLIANQTTRKHHWDLAPVTENASSECTLAEVDPNIVVKCAAGDTRLYFRLVAQAAGTPTASGVVSLTATGIQLLG